MGGLGIPRLGQFCAKIHEPMMGIDDDRPCCAGIFGVRYRLIGDRREEKI
jgi:hypothetical protein